MKTLMKSFLFPAAGFFLLILAAGCTSRPGEEEPAKTNVILIVADDLGYGDLSCYGQETLRTPRIDEMAAQGMMLTRHYTGNTVCAPSRASLLTGKHTGHVSVRGNYSGMLLEDGETTLAECFRQGGYVTGAVGKWGVGHPPAADDPARNGFDYFYGYINMWHAHNFYPEFLYRNGERVPLDNTLMEPEGDPWADDPEGTGVAAEKNEYVHDLFDREGLDFIERNQDTAFFLYMAYNVPHANNEAGYLLGDGMEVPDYGSYADRDWPDPEKGFAAMIENLDRSVGLILDRLEELGLAENTLVIFVSDNGPHEEGNHSASFFDSNGILRGTKRDLYEGGIRTPFIAWWPGSIEPGSASGHVSAFWDLMPTFCEIAGVPVPDESDGISILPTLTGREEEQNQHPYLYWEFYELGGRQALLMEPWKGVRLNVRRGEPVFELYDLRTDPGEETNVAEDYPEITEEILERMEQAHTPLPSISLFEMDEYGDMAF